MPKITKRTVDALKPNPAGKDVFFWDSGDGAIKGFGVRMKPSGAASYLVQYRNKEGRTRRLVLGPTSVLTAEEARTRAGNKLKEVEGGGDPSADRHAIRKSITVTELCDLYIKDAEARAGEEGEIKHSTLKMDKSRIECHIKPLIGRLSVRSLTVEDVEGLQNDIAAGKTAKKREKKGRSGLLTGGRGVAARTVGMLGTILEFAKRRKVIKENPARSVKKFEGGKNKRFLSQAELKALGEAMNNAATENKAAIAAIRALLLTGCRKNEILGLPWAWLDVTAKCIRFADTKSGAQIRPIGKSAVEHFKLQPKAKDSKGDESPWIFPAAQGDGHFVGLPRVLERLCKTAKIKDVTLHVLRHTFAASAAELGFSELTIAGLLGHTLASVTARYSHIPDSALVIAADRVSARITAALEGREDSADIVVLHPAKHG